MIESRKRLFFYLKEGDFMNFGTKLRTVLVVATCLNTALMSTDITGFANVYVDFAYKVISLILNAIIVFCTTWFNNDYTEEARVGTMIARGMKQDANKKAEIVEEPEDAEV